MHLVNISCGIEFYVEHNETAIKLRNLLECTLETANVMGYDMIKIDREIIESISYIAMEISRITPNHDISNTRYHNSRLLFLFEERVYGDLEMLVSVVSIYHDDSLIIHCSPNDIDGLTDTIAKCLVY